MNNLLRTTWHIRLVLTVFLFILVASVKAQFLQQGNKLVGTGAVSTGSQVGQGYSVSMSADGNTAIVGAPLDNNYVGAAWVWTRSNGVWTQQGNKLVGSGSVGSSFQGCSVAISADGNTAVVGGSIDNNSVGAVWVWTRSNGMWTQQGNKLVGTGAVGEAFQGDSVAISADGNTIIVGGMADNNQVGAAWIWTRSNGIWTQQGSKLVGTGAVGTALQGWSVSISADGNTAMVGGIGDDNGLGGGAVWVWTRSNGVWTQQGNKLVGTGAVGGGASQGWSLALSADGNTGIVGGINDGINGIGAAWIWTRSNGVWAQQGNKLVGTGAVGSSWQGSSTALSSDGNTAIIGGFRDGDSGAAWVWTRSNGVWTQQGNKLVGLGAAPYPNLGISVSLSSDGNTAMVGGNGDNFGVGAVWIYVWLPSTPVLSTPIQNATNISISPTLTWNASSRATTYGVQVSTDSTFATTILNDSTVTGTSRSTGTLLNNTVYYWRVNARNSGGISSWSSTNKFTTALPSPPPTCVLSTPTQNNPAVPVNTTLNWNIAPGTTSYRCQLSTDSNFITIIVDDSSLTTNSRAVGPLTNNTIFYWRVRAKNAGGVGAWSSVGKFATVPTAPPQCVLSSPPNNATTFSSSINLTWATSQGATSYRVQVSTNSSFSSTLLDDSTLTTTTRAFNSFNFNTVYYWRVNAKNTGGTSPFSSTWNFTPSTVGIIPHPFEIQYLRLGTGEAIQFNLPKREQVIIQAFNSQGRVISRILDETRDPGYYTLPFKLESDGSYYLEFQAGNFKKIMKLDP